LQEYEDASSHSFRMRHMILPSAAVTGLGGSVGPSAGRALETIREWLQPVGGPPSAHSMEDAPPKITSDAHADDDDNW
jgi:hypothetical protein